MHIGSLAVIGLAGGVLVGVIGIGIEKFVFMYLTVVCKVDTKAAGITSTMSVGFASAFSFLLLAIEGKVPYAFWLMGLPGILIGSTIGPWVNSVLGPRRLLLVFATLCVVEVAHNVLVFVNVLGDSAI